MTPDEAVSYVHEHATTEYLKRDKSGRGYLCPICGSGGGREGTGISTKDGIHFTCWAGCYTSADIIDIIAQKYGMEAYDFMDKLERACEEFGIPLDKPEHKPIMPQPRQKSKQSTQQPLKPPSFEPSEELYKRANAQLKFTDYHRGISLETLNKLHVGFVAHWKHPGKKDNPNVPDSPRLIIPNDGGGYLARDTRANLTASQKKYSKMRVSPTGLFNSAALKQDSQPVYIVEGEIDALSIIDAGGLAVALCSISNVKKLIEAVKANPPKIPLIISLDSDKAGKKASAELEKGLSQLELSFYRYDLPGNFKDANDFLMKDRDSFTKWVERGKNPEEAAKTEEEAGESVEQLVERVEHESVAYNLNNFLETVKKNREGRAIPTGFDNLDRILDGGLYPGLYCVGANSSLGKTTFILQIADNIARAGHGVLFFSLEMSRNELIARTLSRESLLRDMELNNSSSHAKTTRGVLKGIYSDTEKSILLQALKDYSEWGQRISITEGVGDVGIQEITDKVKDYIKYRAAKSEHQEQETGFNSFVVMIDYLQIIAPYNVRATDKQNTDKAVLELKRLSRDYQIPVIGISSFNRENYLAPVSMASFKESGAIEYSSDVLIGMQYRGWDYVKGESEPTRKQRLREIRDQIDATTKTGGSVNLQVKILKHRNGRRGSLLFDYSPMFNCYWARGEEIQSTC